MKIFIVILSGLLLCWALLGCTPEPPEAGFSATPIEGEVPLEVQFTDQSVGEIDQWQWDFNNDGVIDSVLQNPRYIYNEPGIYTVGLTVSNSAGSDHEKKIDFVESFLPCEVAFIAEPTEVVGVKDIKFTDLSQGNISSWSWDFDSDGVIDSTERNPTHAYTRNGNYTVTLTIKGPNCELTVTKDRYIHVGGCG